MSIPFNPVPGESLGARSRRGRASRSRFADDIRPRLAYLLSFDSPLEALGLSIAEFPFNPDDAEAEKAQKGEGAAFRAAMNQALVQARLPLTTSLVKRGDRIYSLEVIKEPTK